MGAVGFVIYLMSESCSTTGFTSQHALPRDRQLRQSDRPWSPDDGKRGLPQLRALDPMPVLGGAGVVSSILNGIMKLASATSTSDICSRSVPRAAEPDLRGHKRAVDAHHLLCLTVAMWAVSYTHLTLPTIYSV